jgi:hypothetical protein
LIDDRLLQPNRIRNGRKISGIAIDVLEALECADPKALAVEDVNYLFLERRESEARQFLRINVCRDCGQAVENESEAGVSPAMEFADAVERKHVSSSINELFEGPYCLGGSAMQLFPGDFVALLFEHGGDAVFADEVAGADRHEGDTVAFEQLLNLGGEVLVALDQQELEEVGVLIAEVGVVEGVEFFDVACVPGGYEFLEFVDGSVGVIEFGDEEVELGFVAHVGEVVDLLVHGFESLDRLVGFDEFGLEFEFDAAVGVVAGLHYGGEAEHHSGQPGLHHIEHAGAGGKPGSGFVELGHLVGCELRRQRVRHVDTELENEGLHGCGVVDVGNFKPERIALLDGGVDFGGVPGMIFVEGVDGAEEVDSRMRALGDPEGRFCGGAECASCKDAKKHEGGGESAAEVHWTTFRGGNRIAEMKEASNTRRYFETSCPGLESRPWAID